MQPSQHRLPGKSHYTTLTLEDMMGITARLNAILLAESDLLGAMKIKEIVPLQEEKQKLSRQIESFQRQLATDRTIVQKANPATRDELLMLTDGLTATITENLRRTEIARGVNQRVMHTLMENLARKERLPTYGRDGHTQRGMPRTMSINLNERA